MSNLKAPDRVSFNFADRCNMNCGYCYIPFDDQPSDISTWKRIIALLTSWDVKSVTFGGGDPFLYRNIEELLTCAANANLFVHVDTNGIGLKPKHFDLICNTVDLVGLPLDGSTTEIHGLMRSNKSHFKTITQLLDGIALTSIPTKVNTVVSGQNVIDLPNLANFLRRWPIAMWSLYQFWPVGHIAISNLERFQITSTVFSKAAAEIITTPLPFQVEAASISVRHNSYFFVTGTGRAYTLDHSDPSKYLELGSIFDENVLERWSEVADPDANRKRLDRDYRAATAMRP